MSAPARSALQKPPGYRDPASAKPDPQPPPRKPQLPPSFRQAGKPTPPHRRRAPRQEPPRRCRRICCWALILLLAATILLAAAAGLCYLWFQPRAPTFRIESLTLTKFRVATRSDGTYLDATAFARLRVGNPNTRISLRYADLNFAISFADNDGDIQIGPPANPTPGFLLRRKNSTVVKLGAGAKGQLVEDAVGSRLNSQFRRRTIRLVVELRTRVAMRIRGRIAGEIPIKVVCAPVSLKQAENKSLSPKCAITLLRWITVH